MIINLIAISLFLLIISFLAFYYSFKIKTRNVQWCKSKRNLHGKTVLITGASAGIGKEAAKDIAERGARVLMVCRNMTKASKVAEIIKRETGNEDLQLYEMDTSDLQSVRQCAAEVLKKETKIDVLINNAGIGGNNKKTLTKDGLELTMATNHFGHFLFTNLLLDLLKMTPNSRIVNVSSILHKLCTDLDVHFERKRCTVRSSYYQSKLCNVLFSCELANILKGTGVTSNAVHPGFVKTEILEKTPGLAAKIWKVMANMVAVDAKLGCQALIHVAVSEEVDNVTGNFFECCKIGTLSPLAQDKNLARMLWLKSEEAVGHKFNI